MKISRQDVGPSFKMRLRPYLDFDGHPRKLGTAPMAGSATSSELKVTLANRPRRVLVIANNYILAAQQ